MMRVPVNPGLLRWARERSGIAHQTLAAKFKNLREWEDGETQPTLRQAEAFANAVHVPIGFLFLTKPPEEAIPIPDFRTVAGHEVSRPSPNLLDTVYSCQERQSWYRDFARVTGEPELEFVGSTTVNAPPATIAAGMRQMLGFDLAARRECQNWTDSLRMFIRRTDRAGVLVMVSGVVANNSHRRLDPNEFRGFALSDPFAPLIFINSKDTRAAQIFTLAHELAHIWLGASALSNLSVAPRSGIRREEVWCNAVATELLVPLSVLLGNLRQGEPIPKTLSRLARDYKVSTLVILRRLLDAQWIGRDCFEDMWSRESERLRGQVRRGAGGGDFYRTTLARVSNRFADALVRSTLEGNTLYRDAFRMLGIKKSKTFNELKLRIGVLG